MREWINIKNKVPEEQQKVWYYFDFFSKVYAGFYCSEDNSSIYGEPVGTYISNCFYSKHGFLNNDVEFWMPREDNDEMPDKPMEIKNNAD